MDAQTTSTMGQDEEVEIVMHMGQIITVILIVWMICAWLLCQIERRLNKRPRARASIQRPCKMPSIQQTHDDLA